MLEITTDAPATDAPPPAGEDMHPAPRDASYQVELREAFTESAKRGREERGELNTDDVKEMLAHAEPEMRSHNITPRDAVMRLTRAEQAVRRDPARAAAWLAASYGADPAQTISAVAQAAGYTPAPEAVAKAYAAVAHENQQAERAALATAERTIAEFAASTDSTGAPRYPRFAEVRAQMGQLIMDGKAKDMETAYAMVTGERPMQAATGKTHGRHYRDDLKAELTARRRA